LRKDRKKRKKIFINLCFHLKNKTKKDVNKYERVENMEEIIWFGFDGNFDSEAALGARREQFRVTICGELDNGPYLARGRGR
jgi:hypothetical protein